MGVASANDRVRLSAAFEVGEVAFLCDAEIDAGCLAGQCGERRIGGSDGRVEVLIGGRVGPVAFDDQTVAPAVCHRSDDVRAVVGEEVKVGAHDFGVVGVPGPDELALGSRDHSWVEVAGGVFDSLGVGGAVVGPDGVLVV